MRMSESGFFSLPPLKRGLKSVKEGVRGTYWSQSPRRRTLQTRDFEIGVEVEAVTDNDGRGLWVSKPRLGQVSECFVARGDKYAGTAATQSVRWAMQEIASQKIRGVEGSSERVGRVR